MINIGTYNYLTVKNISANGTLLTDGELDIPLMDSISQQPEIGDEVFVFVYHHKDGRIIATGKRPFACVGDFAYLKVVDATDTGSFLDLGLDKDLFIPLSKQKHPLELGKSYVVHVFFDQQEGKLTASTRLEDYIDTDLIDLEEGDEVNLLVFDKSELGYSAIFNNRYMGLLYRNEVYENLQVGDTRVGYIKKIRDDINKVDLSLRQQGFEFILDSKDVILDLLKENGGVLELGDKSSPEEINARLKMSKKAFKQIIGGLYRQRLITMTEYEIRLVPEERDLEAE